MSRAEQETTRIYCEIGVETLWLDRPISEVQQDSSSYRISDVYLNVVPRATEGLHVRSNSLGIAPGAGPNRGRLYVCDDRVESLSRKQIVSTTQRKTYRWATAAQILGYAMADEIGHLLGLDAHSEIGVMSAAWRPSDLLELTYDDLTFTPQQAAVIRAEVRMRQQEVLVVAESERRTP